MTIIFIFKKNLSEIQKVLTDFLISEKIFQKIIVKSTLIISLKY